MRRGHRLGLAGLAFLGINGIAIPVVIKSLQSSGLSNNSGRGGQIGGAGHYPNSSGNRFNRSGSSDSQLKGDFLNLTPTDLGLNHSREPLQMSLSSDSGVPQSDSISGVHSEISTELAVRKLIDELNATYDRLSKKGLGDTEDKKKRVLKDFEEAIQGIKNFATKRQKTDKEPPEGLNQAQRRAVQQMYGFYHELMEEREKLFANFSKTVPNDSRREMTTLSPTSLTQSNRPYKEVQEGLKTIEWDKETMKTRKNKTGNLREHGGGDGKENPYRNFYETEQEFIEDLEGLGKSDGGINELKRRIGIMQARGGGQFGGHLAKELSELTSLKDSSVSLIALKVVISLLTSMDKLNEFVDLGKDSKGIK